MTTTWKRGLLAAGMVCCAWSAAAQQRPSIVVDGDDWLKASVTERKAFLVGAGNMILAENAYAKRNNTAPPPAGVRIAAAAQNMTIADIEARVTKWYEANPGMRSTPAMAVIWQDLVKQSKP
ncbi:hypothetical protein CURE108131_13780 [Cupriavidus respiraculi]|uniref:Uncharacterized protein n=1 Tax=Cupriavidus respiraculi TaxID=195930 RepID=A0ABM8XHA0_9BURK|nr:hypothetical protein [Cupriavidus respiraculi]CAG9179542.1 hypothetical protein LMG21510_03809 [Cupriavidus respiraculi]